MGVILVKPDGDTARVELDYVTEWFRDFTPAEFVYRRSRLFTDRGFRRQVTQTRMVAPYLRAPRVPASRRLLRPELGWPGGQQSG